MAKYIDAKVAVEVVDAVWTVTGDKNVAKVWQQLKDLPAADVVPVRRGKWIPENRTMDAFWVCSACGFPSEAFAASILYKYCPNCGARNIEGDDKT